MTRIAHLSDLHFGAHEPALIDPLVEAVTEAAADLVVVSGDLAQRGTAGQMAEAGELLARLPRPLICVPGNHDVPHLNPVLRMSDPWRRFRRVTGAETEGVWRGAGAVVAAINSADAQAWKRGRVKDRHPGVLREALAGAGDALKVVVMHHPLEHAKLNLDPLPRGTDAAMALLPELDVHVVLSGHIHISYAGPFARAPGTLFVQAGTAISDRRRGEANAFSLLDLTTERARVAVHRHDGSRFAPAVEQCFARETGVWVQTDGPPSVP